MHPLLDKAQDYARKSVSDKLNETIDNTLHKIPEIPVVSPIVSNLAHKAKKQATKKIRKTATDTDVLIIGAGISGVLMAHKLKKSRPLDSMIIIEKRQEIGGTWDLFKYPGIRSDSDITTFCFADRPWYGSDTLASGNDIKAYLEDVVADSAIKKYMQFGKVVKTLSWSSQHKMWTVTIKNLANKKTEVLTAKFVVGATGYYNMEKGYQPVFAGQEEFTGQIVHPQRWRDSIDYHDKKVVIIGSGATAVTLLPALLDKSQLHYAKHVTMLQRSPSYIVSVPSSTDFPAKLHDNWKIVSKDSAYQLTRWRAIMGQQLSYKALTKQPRIGKALLTLAVKAELAGSDVPTSHFLPKYDPWDQRVCATPDGEFFDAIKTSRADVVTDEIYRFTKTGIQLTSGQHIDADIIVTATGLNIQMLGGATLLVDDKEVTVGNSMTYKAVLLEEIPNMAVLFGYTNASWTLKIDLATDYIIRLFGHMKQHNKKVFYAHARGKSDEMRQAESVMSALNSGYVHRGNELLPKQGSCYPWLVTNNYLTDRKVLLKGAITDDWLKFEK